MQEFAAQSFLQINGALGHLQGIARMTVGFEAAHPPTAPAEVGAEQAQMVCSFVRLGLRPHCEQLGLPLSCKQIDRFLSQVEGEESFTIRQMGEHVNRIVDRVRDELDVVLFFAVSAASREMHAQPDIWFGPRVTDVFPECHGDLRDACRCFVYEQWTAVVFHSMCILEHGLRALAVEAMIPDEKVSETNWLNIIELIEAEIKKA